MSSSFASERFTSSKLTSTWDLSFGLAESRNLIVERLSRRDGLLRDAHQRLRFQHSEIRAVDSENNVEARCQRRLRRGLSLQLCTGHQVACPAQIRNQLVYFDAFALAAEQRRGSQKSRANTAQTSWLATR